MPPAREPPFLNIGNWGILRTARIHERPMSISGAAVRLAATGTAARIGQAGATTSADAVDASAAQTSTASAKCMDFCNPL
jgi:hypothetical protein